MLWGCGKQWSVLALPAGIGLLLLRGGIHMQLTLSSPCRKLLRLPRPRILLCSQGPRRKSSHAFPQPLPGQGWSLGSGASTLAKGTRLVRGWARLLPHMPCFSPNFIHTDWPVLRVFRARMYLNFYMIIPFIPSTEILRCIHRHPDEVDRDL